MNWKGCTTWAGEVAVFSRVLEEAERAIPEEREGSTCTKRSNNERSCKHGQNTLGWKRSISCFQSKSRTPAVLLYFAIINYPCFFLLNCLVFFPEAHFSRPLGLAWFSSWSKKYLMSGIFMSTLKTNIGNSMIMTLLFKIWTLSNER